MTNPKKSAASEAHDTHGLQDSAAKHLWRHFASMKTAEVLPPRVLVGGDGCYVEDSDGRRLLDSMSGLFCVNIGYGYGEEIGAVAAAQYARLPYAASWDATHLPAVQLAETIAELAPGDLNHVFLTPSGGESVEAAWKMARQYHNIRGEHRWKTLARTGAYHGTTGGALSLMGIPDSRIPFEPLAPGAVHIRNTSRIDRPDDETDADFTAFLLEDLESQIIREGPSTISMLIVEPLQNRGVFPSPTGYLPGMKALCEKYGILFVLDETVTGWGRLGSWFASELYEVTPDILTTAKGLSSGYAVIGAAVASDRVFEIYNSGTIQFKHGNTFGGHPVSAAVALKNIEIMKRLDLPSQVAAKGPELGRGLSELLGIPIIADVRGEGYFWGIEISRRLGHESGDVFSNPTSDPAGVLDPGQLTQRMLDHGLITRILPLDSERLYTSVLPPLVAGRAEIDQIVNIFGDVLTQVSAEAGFTTSASPTPATPVIAKNLR